jgi:hypothetical protein
MNLARLRLPELAAAALASFVVLVTAVAPALLVDAPRADRVRIVEAGARAGMESEALPVRYRS